MRVWWFLRIFKNSIMKTWIVLPAVLFTLNGAAQQLPGFGLTYLNYIDPLHNTGDDIVQQTEWKKMNIDSLNAPIVRQMQSRGLTWEYMEKDSGVFTFQRADSLIIINPTSDFIAELFYSNGAASDLRYAPWDTLHLNDSASIRQYYVMNVVNHYKNQIDLWEIGNEQSHGWMTHVFQPYQYADLVRETAPVIYANDPGAKIILSGLANPNDEWNLNDSNIVWLDSVLTAFGPNPGQYFDLVDCHLYIDWFRIPVFIRKIQFILDQHGCGNKQILVGENGISSSYSNIFPYPGVGTKHQAEQVFSRMCLAVGAGAVQSHWFSHIDDFGNNGNFQGYGSVYHTTTGVIAQKPSWYSLQLLYNELVNFTGVQLISEGDSTNGSGNYVIKFIVNGQEKYVAWNVNGGSYLLSGLTGNTAEIKSTVCNTSVQTIGNLTDEWPVLSGNNPVFQTTNQGIFGNTMTLVLDAAPVLVTVGNTTGMTYTECGMRNISLFPNPFSGKLTLTADEPLDGVTVVMENSYGERVREMKNLTGQSVSICRGKLSSGLYLIRLIRNDQTIGSRKVLVVD